VTLPKGYSKEIKEIKGIKGIKEKVVKQRVPVDDKIIYPLLIILFFIDIGVFAILFFVTTGQDTTLFMIVIYSMSTIISIFFIFFWYYKRHEMDKKDFARLKTIPNYRMYRTVVFLIPVIFFLIIINYANASINNQSLTYIMNNSLFRNSTDFILQPSEPIPSFNGPTFLVFSLVLISQIAYAVTLPSLLAKEFNFYVAELYLENANNQRSDIEANVKKISLFIKGLDSYDKYMRMGFKHRIDKNKIFSKIMADSKLNLYKEIEKLWNAFHSSDKLFPLKEMSQLFNDERAEELLVRVSKFDIIKESIDVIMSAILVVAALIPLLLKT